jgi:hypothetical protein
LARGPGQSASKLERTEEKKLLIFPECRAPGAEIPVRTP